MNSDRSALIVVDMQHYFVEPQSSLMTLVEQLQPGSVTPYVERVRETVIPAIQRLLLRFRALNSPIFFTEFASQTADGSGLPLWARRINDLALSKIGTMAYPAFDDSRASIIPALLPVTGELVLQKTTAGTLSSTDLDTHLSNLEVRSVVVCGVNTDVCVGQTARELADRGYDVVLVEDGCATLSLDAHQATLEMFGAVFGQTKSADEIIGELAAAT